MKPGLNQLSLVLALLLSSSRGSAAEPRIYQVDEDASSMVVHVGKAGLFSFAGHNHDIKVTGFQGRVVADAAALEKSSVELVFASSGLRVVASKEPAGDAPKVQEAMEGAKCLDVSRYPEIQFHSTKVAGKPGNQSGYDLTITGELELHGVKRSLSFPAKVQIENGHLTASGELPIKQKDYGIDPFSAAVGSVRVRNQLTIEFSIVAKATAASH
jgi:polyisoprenoid-binding protein YceI